MTFTIQTPNMLLNLPIPTQELGPQYALDNNLAFGQVDTHNHTSGQGVPVPTAGLNINADLALNGFNLLGARSYRMASQASPLALPGDVATLYVSGGNLYYNNLSGSQVQITVGSTLNAGSIGGFGGNYGVGGSIANYNSSTTQYIFTSDGSDLANVAVGELSIYKTGTSAHSVNLISPTLAASYSLTLPNAIASGANSFLVSDGSGNVTYVTLGTGLAVTSGVLNATTAAVGTPVVSSSTGTFNNSGGGLVAVTNATVTITTTGNAVMLMLQPDGTSNVSLLVVANTSGAGFSDANWYWYRGGSAISSTLLNTEINSGTIQQIIVPPGCLNYLDTSVIGSPGTYTYALYNNANSNQISECHYCKVIAFEL